MWPGPLPVQLPGTAEHIRNSQPFICRSLLNPARRDKVLAEQTHHPTANPRFNCLLVEELPPQIRTVGQQGPASIRWHFSNRLRSEGLRGKLPATCDNRESKTAKAKTRDCIRFHKDTWLAPSSRLSRVAPTRRQAKRNADPAAFGFRVHCVSARRVGATRLQVWGHLPLPPPPASGGGDDLFCGFSQGGGDLLPRRPPDPGLPMSRPRWGLF